MSNLLLLIFTLLIPLENKTSTWFNFGGGLNLTTIFLILIFISLFFVNKQKSSFIVKNPLNFPILLFIVLTYFSLWTGFFKYGISAFGEEFHAYKRFITTFILFYLVIGSVNTKKNSEILIKAMSFMVFIIALTVLKEYMESGIWHYNEESRITLLGMNPNYLGSLFAQFIPIFAASFFLLKSIRSKILNLILFSIGLFALFFTYSRGAYLAIVGALLVMGFLGGKKSFIGTILLVLMVLCASAILFGHGRIIPVSVRERFESIKQEETVDNSIESRKFVWSIAREDILKSPLFGYGYGATRRDLPIDVHNMYLKIAYDCGIPTLLLFIYILLKAFLITIKVFRMAQDDFSRVIALGFLGCLVALIIGNYFGERLGLFSANGYFAILLGIVIVMYSEQNKIMRLKKSKIIDK